MNSSGTICFTVCCLLLAGCDASSQQRKSELVSTTPAVTTRPVIEQVLAEAAHRAETALHQLSRIQSGMHTIPAAPVPVRVPEALMKTADITWTGPLVPFVSKLAELAGYQFVETGTPPVEPVMVTVRATDRPIVSILRDVGLQAGIRANLVVDSTIERIEIIHGEINEGINEVTHGT